MVGNVSHQSSGARRLEDQLDLLDHRCCSGRPNAGGTPNFLPHLREACYSWPHSRDRALNDADRITNLLT